MTFPELRQKAGELAEQIKAHAAKQATWTDEDRSKWTELNAAYDANAKEIGDEERKLAENEAVQKRLAELETSLKNSRTHQTPTLDHLEKRRLDPEFREKEVETQRDFAMRAWIMAQNGMTERREYVEAARAMGVNPHSPQLDITLRHQYDFAPAWSANGATQQRALSVGTPSAGGYTVPEGFVRQLEQKLLAYGGPRSVATVLRTPDGADLPWPNVDSTANKGRRLNEGAAITTATDASFGATVLHAYKYTSDVVKVSSELLQYSAFDMAAWVGQDIGTRLGRIEGDDLTTGDNANNPNGIVTASSLGKTTASATAITADELIDLIHSVDPAYRSGSTGFMMNDGILQYLRKIKTGTGEYLWQPGLQAGIPDRLLSYPITINQHMQSTVATATKTILFGDFSKYVIRDVAAMRFFRLEELYRANDQTGFVAFMWLDGECIQTAAIKHLLQA